ncbi:MAG: UDP-N-acetylmuramate dehydrogenase [Myxococcales bacterium]|nr:UDP-N-acetylmuramate dehydrogenase [Myxococcales bacterium]MCB9731342.1 UDP-N-acetylmuramate dehydrogenase [Deltaproteobacteria bacterium]
MMKSLRERLALLPDVDVTADEPMARHTTYKVGGPAGALVVAHTMAALQATLSVLYSVGAPWFVLGNGSNVLVADRGFDGVVLMLGRGFGEVAVRRDARGAGAHTLEVGGAVSVTKLLRVAKAEKLAGVEQLGGVPASMGGAVRMNAGTRAGDVAQSLLEAQIVVANAAPRWFPARDLGLAYRHSVLPVGAVVTGARFAVTDATDAMFAQLDEVLAYRKATQPLQMPSCGSVFANPPGDAAGRLIEAAGLKGRKIGGAQVSEQHANWIVNTGDATAADVRALIALCVAEVEATAGVTLRPEVQLLGDWEVL